MYQHLNEIITVIHRESFRKQNELIIKITDKQSNINGNFVGVLYKGHIITPYSGTKVTSEIYKNNHKLDSSLVPLADEYVSLHNEIRTKNQTLKQVFGLLFLKCKKDDAVFLNNLPHVLVHRVMEGRPETPEHLYLKEAKESPLFWDQYKKEVIDYVHYTFGSELLL